MLCALLLLLVGSLRRSFLCSAPLLPVCLPLVVFLVAFNAGLQIIRATDDIVDAEILEELIASSLGVLGYLLMDVP